MGVILGIIIFILMVVGFCLAGGNTYESCEKNKKHKLNWLVYCFSVVMLIAFIFVPFGFKQVNTGEIAVKKVWGEAKDIKTAGMHFAFWISTKYDIYDLKVQQIEIDTESYSSDGQTMKVALVVQYQIKPDEVMNIAKNYGDLSMLESRIETVSIEKMKSVLSQKQAMTIIETRMAISPMVEESIRTAITNDYYVDITTVVLTDISFTKKFEETIEEKMIAEQEKLKAEYEKEKAIIKAEEQLEVSKKEAEAQLIKASGEANAIMEISKAQANSIKLKSVEIARMLGFTINETITEDGTVYNIDFTGKSEEEIKVISDYLKYVEYLEVWNGELPNVITDSGTTIMIPTI